MHSKKSGLSTVSLESKGTYTYQLPIKKTMRLNKFLAHAGIISRRKVADFLLEHEVVMNGERVTDPARAVDPQVDTVTVDGTEVSVSDHLYLMLHKPRGVLSTVRDERGRKTVLDLVATNERLYPVGRLDKDTTGLLLLTNDGELANHLTHPRYHVPKTYEVTVRGAVSKRQLERLQQGVLLEDGMTAPAEVRILRSTRKETTLEIVLYEGRKRQVRRMCAEVSLPLRTLHRSAFGPLSLGDLPRGHSRPLTSEEIRAVHTLS